MKCYFWFLICLGVLPPTTLAGVEKLLARAQDFAAAGNFAAALPVFTDVADKHPDDYRGHAGRAAMLNRLDRFAEGLAAIDRAVALAPDRPMLRYNRGLALWEVGRFSEAVAEFDRAAAGRPELPMPYADRALAKLSLGDLPGAREDCARALAADPGYIWARYYRAMTHYAAGEFPAALEDFAAVATNQPDFPAARLWQYISAGRSGRVADGFLMLTPATDWPAPLLALFKGDITTEDLLSRAQEQRVPDDDRRLSAAHTVLGLWHLFSNRTQEAQAAFSQALSYPVPNHFEQIVARSEFGRLPLSR